MSASTSLHLLIHVRYFEIDHLLISWILSSCFIFKLHPLLRYKSNDIVYFKLLTLIFNINRTRGRGYVFMKNFKKKLQILSSSCKESDLYAFLVWHSMTLWYLVYKYQEKRVVFWSLVMPDGVFSLLFNVVEIL